MSDLISRSDTMKRLRDYAEQKHYNGEVELANGILKAICFIENEENIPTAYDVKKVLLDLEEAKGGFSQDAYWTQGIFKLAIEKVETGWCQ